MTNRTIIALASDHAGYPLKEILKTYVSEIGYQPLDLGTNASDSVDYPDYGHAIADAITSGKAAFGIAVCGSGIGISIAANRHAGVRAALCNNGLTAALARQHNDANVLALGARLIGEEIAKDCVKQFLQTKFEGGRHQRRVEKIEVGA